MAKKRKWLYNKDGRFYGDFRPYADVGGGQEAMKAEGERFATKDYRVAKALARERLRELKRLRQHGHSDRAVDLRLLGNFIDHHLVCEAEKGVPAKHLRQTEQQLNVAAGFFGDGALLRSIVTAGIHKYIAHLRQRRPWQGSDREGAGTLEPETILKYLAVLSKTFRRARAEGIIPTTHRPFDDLMDKPAKEPGEAEWLSGPVAALLLEAARLYRPRRAELAVPCAHTIVATLLLTGMRPAEGLGLRIEDIDFERKLIKVKPNPHRRLKNKKSKRLVPLWPQLESILRTYLARRGNPTAGVLFPSPKAPSRPVRHIKRVIDELSLRIEFEGRLSPKVFRHTYCTARLQTTDRGAPITLSNVADELGHNRTTMVEAIYGHIDFGDVQFPRRSYVEISLADYQGHVEDRLERLQARTDERNGFAPNFANRVKPEVEIAVIESAGRMPDRGPKKVAATLNEEGVEISASGVHWVLKRHGLHRAEYRRRAIRDGRLEELVKEVRVLRYA
jgi:integrase